MLASHPVIGLVAFVVACLVMLFAGVTIATMRLLTRPPRRTYATALASGRPGDPSELPAPSSHPNHIWAWKKWTLHTLGMDLPVWEIEGLHASGPAIILTHGWGDSRIGALARISSLAPIASRLIAWDMPGHGDAPGTCSLGTNEVDALSNLIERLTAGTHAPIILLGWSLGAGVSIAAAAKPECDTKSPIVAVIAENPYRLAHTPAANVLRLARLPHSLALKIAIWLLDRLGHASGLTHPDFDRRELSRRLNAPLLVIHGDADNVCPIADGREIAAAASQGSICVIPGGGHHGLWTSSASQPLVFEAVRAFLQTLPPR